MPDLDLDAIEDRANAADPLPWDLARDGIVVHQGDPEELLVCGPYTDENALFLVHSKADVVALVAEVRRLRAVVTRQERTIEGYERYPTSADAHEHDFQWSGRGDGSKVCFECVTEQARVDTAPVLGEGWMDAAAQRAFRNQVARDELKRTDAGS
jgi:hypothetical protein